jgi:hypothetical protein
MELGKAVQMFGVVYAQPLADELLLSRALREQLSDSDRHLLASFRSACSYLLDWSLDGAPFEELAFLSELCRQDVIAAGKTQV